MSKTPVVKFDEMMAGTFDEYLKTEQAVMITALTDSSEFEMKAECIIVYKDKIDDVAQLFRTGTFPEIKEKLFAKQDNPYGFVSTRETLGDDLDKVDIYEETLLPPMDAVYAIIEMTRINFENRQTFFVDALPGAWVAI